MAERLKVFLNRDLGSTDIVNGNEIPLIQNDGTTQVVVKDVLFDFNNSTVDYTDGTLLPLKVSHNEYQYATLTSMSGNEIIDVNDDFKLSFVNNLSNELSFTPKLTINYIQSASSGYTKIVDNFFEKENTVPYNKTDLDLAKKYFDNTLTDINQLFLNEDQSIPSMTNPAWFFYTNDYALYFSYDGNTTTQLYRASVDINGNIGTWVIVDQASSAYKAIVPDEEKVYWVDGTSLYEYDAPTDTTTLIGDTGEPTTPKSYTAAGFCNDVFMWVIGQSNGNRLKFWRRSNNTFGTINLSTPIAVSSDQGFGIAFNPLENKYYVASGYGGNLHIYSISGDFIDGDAATYIGNESLFPDGIWNSMSYVSGNAFGEMFIYNSLNHRQKVKFENDLITSVYVVTDETKLLDSGWFEARKNFELATLDWSDVVFSLRTKVSGVEITGVV